MSAYQQYINESLAAQHRQDLMRQSSTERALRAMRSEQQSDREEVLTQPVGAVSRSSRLRRAWRSLATHLASFL
jgi:predicted nucleic acid-binding Zn ribbon protein